MGANSSTGDTTTGVINDNGPVGACVVGNGVVGTGRLCDGVVDGGVVVDDVRGESVIGA